MATMGMGGGIRPGGVGATISVGEIAQLSKGSLIVGDGAGAPIELAVGSDGQVLVVDSAQAAGVKFAARPEVIVLAADQTITNSTTFVTITGFTFAIAANEKVFFRTEGYCVTPAAADWKTQFIGPTSPTLVGGGVWNSSLNSGNISNAQRPTTFGQTFHHLIAGSSGTWQHNIYIENGANAGTVELQFAQDTADAGNTTMKAGSWMELFRLP